MDIQTLLKLLPLKDFMQEYTKAQAADCRRRLEVIGLVVENMDDDGKVDGKLLIGKLLAGGADPADTMGDFESEVGG